MNATVATASSSSSSSTPSIARRLAIGLILCVIGAAGAMAADGGSAAALRASYAAQRAEIEKNQFGKPLHLQSRQTSNTLQGDIHALIDQPFDKVQAALAE